MRRGLEPWLVGRTIRRAERVDAPPGPKYADLERASGQTIEAANRRGKFLLLPLSGGDELVIHLGMTGVVSAEPPANHVRAKLTLDGPDKPTLYFQDVRRFGRFLVVPQGAYQSLPTLHAMGPEPLSDDFTAAHLRRALGASVVAVKTYLLSQKPVAGVGNIYADEALWRSRIHPETPSNRVSKTKIAPLVRAIRDVLAASIEAQGTTFSSYRTVNGEVGSFVDHLDVYGHAEQPCPRCGTPISKIVVAGRGTHFCSKCQKVPRQPKKRQSQQGQPQQSQAKQDSSQGPSKQCQPK
ncbi:MAG: bifunctional DNA-formamidopyrimidine glycosylase/DNA-(apurinic or apyrimidinic site) lyase [Trueperaceae bacterium]|nr:bifunctional DNA-formamidopyrimidine glycosylase/DNA-(apurinic or apyrimidinic site) lyase [Trueperaceae bacterium]